MMKGVLEGFVDERRLMGKYRLQTHALMEMSQVEDPATVQGETCARSTRCECRDPNSS